MAHPDWVLKHKVKNSEIRNIRGRYYLYAITSKWDPIKKRTKKVTLGMLGVISQQEGFIPKGQSKKGRPAKEKEVKNISIKEFGASNFLQQIGSDIKAELQKCFPTQWQSLFALALNRLIYQSPLKNCEFLFEESFVSEELTEAKLDKNSCTQLLQVVGGNREKISEFLRQFVKGAEHIVFDTSHITSHSNKTKMAQRGYNSARDYDPQVNLFYMFSVDRQEPSYYRLFPGNIHGVSALKNCLEESEIKNCIAIGDKGFCSENNIDLLEKAGLTYILPLKRNSVWIDYTRLEKRLYQEAFDGHFMYQDRPIFYTCLEEKDNKQVIIFTDKSLALEEEKSYLRQLNMEKDGYSMATYQDKQIKFGTIAMITNCKDKTASKVYEAYKTRMEVETVFDSYKNLLEADRTYMQSDKSMEGWAFINHLATMLYYRVFNLLKTHDLLKSTSPSDLLLKLARINKIKINKCWILAEINSKTAKLIHKLNIHVT
jgi:hypothetical protein